MSSRSCPIGLFLRAWSEWIAGFTVCQNKRVEDFMYSAITRHPFALCVSACAVGRVSGKR
eukprot:877290-Alexandrium_andersonii.AAC.1